MALQKVCKKCLMLKSADAFYPVLKGKPRLRAKCKVCQSEEYKQFYKQEGSLLKHAHLKDYWPGSTTQEALGKYNALLMMQNNVCFICRKLEKDKRLAVDHDHTTLEVRNLLCENCNRALGLIKEDFHVALELAKYIQLHKNVV